MQKQADYSYCPSCSSKVVSGSAFCGRCGYSIKGDEAVKVEKVTLESAQVQNTWAKMKNLIKLYGILLAASLFFGLTSRVYDNPKLEVIYWVIDFITIFVFLKLTWSESKKSFSVQPATPKVLLEIALLTFGAYLFITFYFKGFDLIGVETIGITESYLKAGWPVWSIFVMSAVLPGVFEEILFRGILQPNLEKLISQKEALIIQAALFSVLHLLPAIFISHFVMGLLVGWIRLRLGHIYYGIVLHMLWNGYVIYGELLLK